jgi:hypothetical protein
MRASLLTTVLVLAGCAPPFPVHRGEGGIAPPEEEGGMEVVVDAGADPSPVEDSAAGGSSGGSGGTGGSATGGLTGTGGRATGGVTGTGGSGTGGMVGTGGVSGTGGMVGTGGVSGTGGMVGTGGCSDVDVWKVGMYKGGDEVKHGNPAHRYRCREFPFEGWCGITAYEPGGGGPWMDAWLDVGACP